MTFVSNNALHMLGYRPEEMVADPNFWFDHIHPDDARIFFPAWLWSLSKASAPPNTVFAPPMAAICGCTIPCA